MKREVSSLRTEISRLRVIISSITIGVPINKVEVRIYLLNKLENILLNTPEIFEVRRRPPASTGAHKNSLSDEGSTFSSSATSNYSGDWLSW